jgi:hypothetical protein
MAHVQSVSWCCWCVKSVCQFVVGIEEFVGKPITNLQCLTVDNHLHMHDMSAQWIVDLHALFNLQGQQLSTDASTTLVSLPAKPTTIHLLTWLGCISASQPDLGWLGQQLRSGSNIFLLWPLMNSDYYFLPAVDTVRGCDSVCTTQRSGGQPV